MAYAKPNDSVVIVGEDSESGFDQIHAELLQHFTDEIRISNMGSTADRKAAVDVDKSGAVDCDNEATDQISGDALHKAQKQCRDNDVSSTVPPSEESKLFDAGGGGGGSCGTSSVNLCFTPGSLSGGAGTNSFVFGCISTTSLEKPDESSAALALQVGTKGRSVSKNSTIGKVYRKIKEPPLNVSFPSKIGSYELKILKQPEEQHRARYLTEGSRGTVKDQSGHGHPTVKLCGYDQPVALQVFVGTDVGRMKPHGFYQACKVSNKNSTACMERDIEGTTVIEIMFDPNQEMIAVVDCVGILKLRNADVEQRIGLAKSKKKKVPTATLR